MKSKNIQLVLITAALASCNRALIIPEQQFTPVAADSALIMAPSYTDTLTNNSFAACNCEAGYYRLWNYAMDPNADPYSIVPFNSRYYFPEPYENKALSWSGDHVIVRGGFGSCCVETIPSSSSWHGSGG
ncbi:hypothetical protein F5148DRAFT_1290906 [Russula earlei]|uniref:Uncharacterized protein n=1 Tax=Russula earlei TaxID=71964 RepID=A0ACC0TVY2_9AGAM|nr:hypothetical protein F5148DRAFT_1290906 [Russula earlei]